MCFSVNFAYTFFTEHLRVTASKLKKNYPGANIYLVSLLIIAKNYYLANFFINFRILMLEKLNYDNPATRKPFLFEKPNLLF